MPSVLSNTFEVPRRHLQFLEAGNPPSLRTGCQSHRRTHPDKAANGSLTTIGASWLVGTTQTIFPFGNGGTLAAPGKLGNPPVFEIDLVPVHWKRNATYLVVARDNLPAYFIPKLGSKSLLKISRELIVGAGFQRLGAKCAYLKVGTGL